MNEMIDITSEAEALADDRRVTEIAVEINTIKRSTAQSVLQSAIEIGRLLCEAKDKLHHGEWGEWLRANVSYSVSNANNMMRLYKEFHRSEQVDLFGDNDFGVFEGMNMSQVLAVLPLPPSERREFIEETGARELSSRDIQAEIKKREEAEKTASDALIRLEAAEIREAQTAEDLKAASDERDQLSEEVEDLRSELEELKACPVPESEMERIHKEAEAKFSEKAQKKIEAAKKDAEKKIADAKKTSEEEAKKLREKWEAEKAKIDEDAKIAAEAEAAQRIQEAEEKAKSTQVAASPHLTAFKIHMEALKENYRKLSEVVETAEREEPQVGASLRAGLEKLVEMLK